MAVISVGELLRTDCLAGGKLMAGKNGLARKVTRVTVMEVPDYHRFINPGELVLTTGYGVKDDRTAQLELVPTLARANAAALAVKCRWLPRLDPDILALADRLGLPVIELPMDVPWSTLVENVSRVLLGKQGTPPGSAGMGVMEALSANGNASALVEQLGVLLGGVTLVTTATGSILLGPYGSIPAPTLQQLVGGWAADHGQGAGSGGLAQATVRVDGEQIRVVRVPLQVQGREHPHLWVLFSGEPPGESLQMIERAAVALARLVGSDERQGVERKHLTRFFQLWLSGMGGTVSEMQARARLLGYALPEKHYLLYLRVEGTPPVTPKQLNSIAEYIAMYLSSRDAGDLVSEVADGVLFLVAVRSELPPDWPRQHGNSILQAVATRWPDLKFAMAVGPVVDKPDELPAAYKELGNTLQIRDSFGLPGALWCEADIRLYRLLYRLHSSEELQRFLAMTTGRLAAHDNENGADLLTTLVRFLQCGRNIRETAAAMYTHYNTVRYRLRQIEKLTGRSLDNAEHCFELELASRLQASFGGVARAE